MNKISVIISAFIVMGVIVITPIYCQEEEALATSTIDGNVVSADWEKSIIIVKWPSQSGEIGFKETAVFVPESIKITGGEDTVGLMDINVGAHVIVEYYESYGKPTAKSVTVIE